ncbi:MAG TPA: sigma-70 family RNA polymerase sigma factor [Solirubrobacterales bacterium]|nr:sigma-70 family RNA polymerase sigma factor [Solirubrobacterales bacterium]
MSPTATDTLAREASGGDERALSEIFREFHQPLYRYCLAILGNRQDAEDALQETMIKVLLALPGEKRTIALKPWLYRIAHNESIDLLRRRRASVPLEDGEPAPGESLAEQVETRQRLGQLIVDLGALPERQRGTLLMREAADLDFEEIAAALETSPAVARQTLYEARLGLRQMDAGRDMDCTAVTKALSDGDRRVRRRRDIRAHLRDCADCRQFAEEIDSRRSDLAAISPLPAIAATALLRGVLGGGIGAGAATTGGGAGAAGASGGLLGGAAAKSVGTATLLKGAAALAVVAAIGVGAADRGGLIHVGSHDPAPTVRSGAGGGGQSASDATTPSSAESGADSTGSPWTQHGSQSAIGAAHAASSASNRAVAKSAASPPDSPPTGTSAEEASSASPTPGKSGVEHPHGRAHAKQTPAAATHGQETAASNKPEEGDGSDSPGTGESNGSKPTDSSHPAHPTHPSHPTQSAKPAGSPQAAKPAAMPEGKKP